MVSVALFFDRQGPLPRANWSQREQKIARRAAKRVLEGVGDPTTDVLEDGPEITIALRRQCRDEERRKVLEKFLSV
jgi:cobalamin-dependent methionine synthase I